MKKIAIIIVLVMGCISTSFAQQKGAVEFGMNIGYNSSTITASTYLPADNGSGINVGIAADYYFSDRWSIKGKLIYDQKGYNNDYSLGFYTNINTNYLTVPVMVNWHFGKKRNWYLNFGPYAGFLLSAKETVNNTDLKSSFYSTDFGLSVGIGVKIPVSDKLKLAFEYDAQSGLSDVIKDNNRPTTLNSRGSFNVGFNFLMK